MGGETTAKSALKTLLSQFQSHNMKLESIAFPDPPVFLETDDNRFVILRTKNIISVNEHRIESLQFQFGVQRKGTATWKYVDGSELDNQKVRSLFPDFPPDYK